MGDTQDTRGNEDAPCIVDETSMTLDQGYGREPLIPETVADVLANVTENPVRSIKSLLRRQAVLEEKLDKMSDELKEYRKSTLNEKSTASSSGTTKTTMEDLAKTAQNSAASIYRILKRQTDLENLTDDLEEKLEHLTRRVSRYVTSAPNDVEPRVTEQIQATVASLTKTDIDQLANQLTDRFTDKFAMTIDVIEYNASVRRLNMSNYLFRAFLRPQPGNRLHQGLLPIREVASGQDIEIPPILQNSHGLLDVGKLEAIPASAGVEGRAALEELLARLPFHPCYDVLQAGDDTQMVAAVKQFYGVSSNQAGTIG